MEFKKHFPRDVAAAWFRQAGVNDFTPEACEFASGAMEYLAAEVLELAGNCARSERRPFITGLDIELAIEHDVELIALKEIVDGKVSCELSLPLEEDKDAEKKTPLDPPQDFNRSALMRAVLAQDERQVRAALQGLDEAAVNAVSAVDMATPLEVALEHNNMAMCRLLITHGARVRTVHGSTASSFETALHVEDPVFAHQLWPDPFPPLCAPIERFRICRSLLSAALMPHLPHVLTDLIALFVTSPLEDRTIEFLRDWPPHVSPRVLALRMWNYCDRYCPDLIAKPAFEPEMTAEQDMNVYTHMRKQVNSLKVTHVKHLPSGRRYMFMSDEDLLVFREDDVDPFHSCGMGDLSAADMFAADSWEHRTGVDELLTRMYFGLWNGDTTDFAPPFEEIWEPEEE